MPPLVTVCFDDRPFGDYDRNALVGAADLAMVTLFVPTFTCWTVRVSGEKIGRPGNESVYDTLSKVRSKSVVSIAQRQQIQNSNGTAACGTSSSDSGKVKDVIRHCLIDNRREQDRGPRISHVLGRGRCFAHGRA